MSESLKKKRKTIQELLDSKLEDLIAEERLGAHLEEKRLLEAREKLTERDLPVEKFLSREAGALAKYNKRRKMHIEIERMPVKEIEVETIETVEPTEHFIAS